jgi:hypothetical protein
MKVVLSSETSVNYYQPTQRHISNGITLEGNFTWEEGRNRWRGKVIYEYFIDLPFTKYDYCDRIKKKWWIEMLDYGLCGCYAMYSNRYISIFRRKMLHLSSGNIGTADSFGKLVYLLLICITTVQTGSGAHPASYGMGTGGSFPGGKAAGLLSWPVSSN